MKFFTSEICLDEDGHFYVVDYINADPDMNPRSYFADGMISESVYKTRSAQFKKQTDSLVKRWKNISPSELSELEILEDKIALIKETIDKGRLDVTEFGLFASYDDCYTPVGFNAWRETDGKMAIGEVWEMDSFGIEGTDLKMRGIGAPPEFWEAGPEEQSQRIGRNMRAILQFFNIKVFVFPERVEIRGAIPTQVLTREEPSMVPIIKSARGIQGDGALTSGRPRVDWRSLLRQADFGTFGMKAYCQSVFGQEIIQVRARRASKLLSGELAVSGRPTVAATGQAHLSSPAPLQGSPRSSVPSASGRW